MKNVLLTSLVAGVLVGSLHASEKDVTVSIYDVSSKLDKNRSSKHGLGVKFDNELTKISVESNSDFFRAGAILRLNSLADGLYVKLALNYLNQELYITTGQSDRVNQYSGAFDAAYMLREDIYIKVGGSITELHGTKIGTSEIKNETTSLAYVELVKRWETGIGIIDTSTNVGEIYYEHRSDEFSYGIGVDYYPVNNMKIGINHQNEDNNIQNTYALQYGYVFGTFADNVSTDTWQGTAGVKIAFNNLFDVSTWKAPTEIAPHLSELNRFEAVTSTENMEVQSSDGVEESHSHYHYY